MHVRVVRCICPSEFIKSADVGLGLSCFKQIVGLSEGPEGLKELVTAMTLTGGQGLTTPPPSTLYTQTRYYNTRRHTHT